MHKAQLTITIPDGYALAEPEPRIAKTGELFLDAAGVPSRCASDTAFVRPILRRDLIGWQVVDDPSDGTLLLQSSSGRDRIRVRVV